MLAADEIESVGKHALKTLGIGALLRPADKLVKSKVRHSGVSEGGHSNALEPRKFAPRDGGCASLIHPYPLLGFKQHIHAACIPCVTDLRSLCVRDRSVQQVFPIQKDVSADGADVSVKAESADLRLNVPERAAGVDYEDVSCALRFFQRGTRAFGNDVVRCHDRPVHIKKEDLSIHISIITRRQFATKPPKCKD